MSFRFTFSEEKKFKMTFKGGVTEKIEEYAGPYEVIPRTFSQTLDTNNKKCTSDIEVEAVPYLEVSNPQGGYTATIAYL